MVRYTKGTVRAKDYHGLHVNKSEREKTAIEIEDRGANLLANGGSKESKESDWTPWLRIDGGSVGTDRVYLVDRLGRPW